MSQLQEIARQKDDLSVIVQLTSTFEELSSMHIQQTKNRVLRAQSFFYELWDIYRQLRVDSLFRLGRTKSDTTVINKVLYLLITSPAGLSGDIDERLIATMLKSYNRDANDIIVVGRHGATLLNQKNIRFKKYFQLPEKDERINVEPLVREIRQYANAVVFYQAYTSLMTQEIRQMEMSAEVRRLGAQAEQGDEVISEQTYIFEPSAHDVIAHLERSMLQITLAQVIFDSKLAQYASRFMAMRAAHEKAQDSLDDVTLSYNRTRRSQRDERLKQMINNVRKMER